MKKTFVALAMFAVFASLLALAAPAHADLYAPDLNVVLTNQTPYPVEPGINVDLGIQLQNSGKGSGQDVYLVIVPDNPFELLPGQDSIKFFNEVPALDGVKASYKLHVNSSAITNTYDLSFQIYIGSLQGPFFTEKVGINVQGIPDLLVDDLSISPQAAEPGSVVKVDALVKNVGTGSARNIQMQFNSTADEIKPILSKGTVFAGDIAPGQSAHVVFDVSISSSAEEKTYTIPLIASYKNENNNAVTETFSVGLPVRGSVMLDIVKIEPLYDRDTLRVEIANKGTTSAKSIEASLVLNNKTIDVDYVSELKATKKTTMDFSPLVQKGVAQLVINYVGPGLEKNQVTKEISLNFANGGSGDGTGIAIVITIVVVVAGYYFWNRRKKKKKHSQ